MTHEELLNIVVKDNVDALDFLKRLGFAFRCWDDVWDGDREVSKESLDEVFSDLSFDLSRNPFYYKHRDVLDCQIFLAWNAWKDSNEWQGNSDRLKSLCAFFVRDYCNEIVQLVAFLIGGKNHARDVSLMVREFYLNQLIAGGFDGFL